jgi:CheY-like chemotaxis protein
MSVSDKKSILVIDDDITIRKLISHHLNLHDYKVFLAANTDEGFNQLYNNNIDLVLCDIIMDKMDGFTFCQLVRENENYRSLPFVFVTAKILWRINQELSKWEGMTLSQSHLM